MLLLLVIEPSSRKIGNLKCRKSNELPGTCLYIQYVKERDEREGDRRFRKEGGNEREREEREGVTEK